MILHCVFCNFRGDAPLAERQKVLSDLKDLSLSLNGVLGFDFGANLDFENKSPDHDHGFVIRFADQDAADRYTANPVHQKLGARLCGLCENGAEGIMVYDLSV